MALILAQQSPTTKTAKQQSSLDNEKVLPNSGDNNNNSTIIKTKRSTNSLDIALFSSITTKNDGQSTIQSQDLNDLSKSIDLSISESGRVLSSSSSLSLLSDNNNVDFDNEKSEDNNEINSNDEEQQKNSFEELNKAQKLHISGAGLVYPYRFEAIYLRFGNEFNLSDEFSTSSSSSSSHGSEHKINSRSFSGELQLMAYNSLLYKSYYEASTKPNGLLGIAILLELKKSKKDDNNQTKQQSLSIASIQQQNNDNNNNYPLGILLEQVKNIKFRDESVIIKNFNLSALLPDLEHFVSYDGSLTTPGCHESVNWLILNKPLYITQSNVSSERSITIEKALLLFIL